MLSRKRIKHFTNAFGCYIILNYKSRFLDAVLTIKLLRKLIALSPIVMYKASVKRALKLPNIL